MAVTNRAWAVGACAGGPAILYFNGTSWSLVSLRNKAYGGGDGEQTLFAHGVDEENIWFAYVTPTTLGAPDGSTIFEKYNALTNTWTTFPAIAAAVTELIALSATDVWAIAQNGWGGPVNNDIWHYDGVSWSLINRTVYGGGTAPFTFAVTRDVFSAAYRSFLLSFNSAHPGWKGIDVVATGYSVAARQTAPYSPSWDRRPVVIYDSTTKYFYFAVPNGDWIGGDRPIQLYRSQATSDDPADLWHLFGAVTDLLSGIGYQGNDHPHYLIRGSKRWVVGNLINALTSRTAYYAGGSWSYYPAAATGLGYVAYGLHGSNDGNHVWMAVGKSEDGIMVYWDGSAWVEYDVHTLTPGDGITRMYGVFVLPGVLPTAAFSGTPLSGEAPLTVAFTDASEDTTSWAWNFGDGGTSTEQHPTHVYATPGLYTVSLVATNDMGSDTETKVDYVLVIDPNPIPQPYWPWAREVTEEHQGAGVVEHPLIVRHSMTMNAQGQADIRYYPLVKHGHWVRLAIHTHSTLPAGARLKVYAMLGGYDAQNTLEEDEEPDG